MTRTSFAAWCLIAGLLTPAQAQNSDAQQEVITINRKEDGYRGIWYMNQPSGDEYVYKYSGGLVLRFSENV